MLLIALLFIVEIIIAIKLSIDVKKTKEKYYDIYSKKQ